MYIHVIYACKEEKVTLWYIIIYMTYIVHLVPVIELRIWVQDSLNMRQGE